MFNGIKSKEDYYLFQVIPKKKNERTEPNNLFSRLYHYFSQTTNEKPSTNSKSGIILTHQGILPQKTTDDTTFFLNKDIITAPITINYSDQHDFYTSDYSSLNSSLSSSSSFSSSHCHRNSISSIALSEILCDHYVNRHQQDNEHQVPLETYKVFEASPRHTEINHHSSSQDDWFIWDTLQTEKEWIQVLDEQKVIVEIPIPFERSRNPRMNPAHLRIIVAEVNMMRANKIVCPLKPRSALPPRNQHFTPNLPSPLGFL